MAYAWRMLGVCLACAWRVLWTIVWAIVCVVVWAIVWVVVWVVFWPVVWAVVRRLRGRAGKAARLREAGVCLRARACVGACVLCM